jgi:ribosomal protein L37AE/L43A
MAAHTDGPHNKEDIKMTIENVKKIIHDGGYICWTNEDRPYLYNRDHKTVCRVPMATAERMARENGVYAWYESWGGYYVGHHMSRKYRQHENNRQCERIAEDANDYATGSVYRCPECGHEFTAPEDCEIYRCPHCENVAELDEYDQQSIYDYLEGCLDIEYRCGSRREYRSVQIMVAWGGPNIYIDTASALVELYWGGEKADYPLSREAVEALDEHMEELFNC